MTISLEMLMSNVLSYYFVPFPCYNVIVIMIVVVSGWLVWVSIMWNVKWNEIWLNTLQTVMLIYSGTAICGNFIILQLYILCDEYVNAKFSIFKVLQISYFWWSIIEHGCAGNFMWNFGIDNGPIAVLPYWYDYNGMLLPSVFYDFMLMISY